MRYLIYKMLLFNSITFYNPNAQLQSITTNGREEYLQRMPQWGENANGFNYKHMCIIYSCVHIQGWLHNGKHLHVCNCNFELQQGDAHHAPMILGYNYCRALVINISFILVLRERKINLTKKHQVGLTWACLIFLHIACIGNRFLVKVMRRKILQSMFERHS